MADIMKGKNAAQWDEFVIANISGFPGENFLSQGMNSDKIGAHSQETGFWFETSLVDTVSLVISQKSE